MGVRSFSIIKYSTNIKQSPDEKDFVFNDCLNRLILIEL
jgi:hypothetical protein